VLGSVRNGAAFLFSNNDGILKSRLMALPVVAAKAEIQCKSLGYELRLLPE
jgi:hypothetical protein